MKRFLPAIVVFVLCFLFTGQAFAQDSSPRRSFTAANGLPTYNVGIFAPIYLDSVFSYNTYRYGKKFPRFAMPGLDFILGAQVALDSMKPMNANINAMIFDSKGKMDIPAMIAAHKLDSLKLIIGAVKDEEVQQLAAFAKLKNIPFISATFPNDAGVMQTPNMLILNSTLFSHCEAIYNFVAQSHGNEKIFLIRKPGGQEDRIQQYFNMLNVKSGKPLLNINVVTITDDFAPLKEKLDSTRSNIFIGGSLQETFASRLVKAAAEIDKTNTVTLVGMPNWDGFVSLTNKNAAPDFPVYYTTPFFNYKWDKFSKMIQQAYMEKFKGSPSDMSYKGFEAVYVFADLLSRHPFDFMEYINDTQKVFSEYNFKPVFASPSSISPDYYENRHFHFIKILNGRFSKAW